MMKIFEALRADHEKQRVLLNILVDTQGATSARASFYQELKQQLKLHAIAEERYFYAPLLQDDSTIDLARHAIAEHHEIDEFIAILDETELSSPAWLKTMKALQHTILHHLEDEELNFFQQAGKVLTVRQKDNLADDYIKAMQTIELDK